MKRLFLLPALAIALTYMACSDTGQESSLTAPNPSFTVTGNPVVASASGSGHFEFEEALRPFSFTAQRLYDGTVQGQFQANFRNRVQGTVTCITTDGSGTARIGGIIRSNGLEAFFTVVDNSEGPQSPADQITFMGTTAGGTGRAELHCTNGVFVGGLFDILRGNIQVDQQGDP